MITEIRGYAAPFDQPTYIGARLERFASSAFSDMLSKPHKVQVRWFSHDDDAPIFDDRAYLFADEYGIGFRARVDMGLHRPAIASMVSKSRAVDGASVGGLIISKSRREAYGCESINTITAATFDHITITAEPAYRGSAAWPAHCSLDFAPLNIRNAAARWTRGYASHSLKGLTEAFGNTQGRAIFERNAAAFFGEAWLPGAL